MKSASDSAGISANPTDKAFRQIEDEIDERLRGDAIWGITEGKMRSESGLVHWVHRLMDEMIEEAFGGESARIRVFPSKDIREIGATPDLTVWFDDQVVYGFEVKYFLAKSVPTKAIKRDIEKLRKMRSRCQGIRRAYFIYAIDALQLPLIRRGGPCPRQTLDDQNHDSLRTINHRSTGLARDAN